MSTDSPSPSTCSSSSQSTLRALLQGIQSERGALVSCRDAPSFEMIMRMNRNANGKLVVAVLKSSPSAQSSTVVGGARVTPLFLRDAVRAEEEVQLWLDPFRKTERTTSDRRRRREEGADDSGSDLGESDDEE